MMHLGIGYDLWARIVDKMLTINQLDNFLTVAAKPMAFTEVDEKNIN